MNHQTRPTPRGTVNFGYHESKTGKNIMKVEAIDNRKGRGSDKVQCILQNNVILNLVLQWSSLRQKLSPKIIWQL